MGCHSAAMDWSQVIPTAVGGLIALSGVILTNRLTSKRSRLERVFDAADEMLAVLWSVMKADQLGTREKPDEPLSLDEVHALATAAYVLSRRAYRDEKALSDLANEYMMSLRGDESWTSLSNRTRAFSGAINLWIRQPRRFKWEGRNLAGHTADFIEDARARAAQGDYVAPGSDQEQI